MALQSLSMSAHKMRLVLFAMLMAAASAFSLAAWAQPDGGHGMHGGRHGARMMERMLDDVKASDAQRTQIRQIWEAARADLKSQREAGRALREQQMALFAQPTVDANAVEALRQKMLAQHDQTSKRISQAMLDASRVLTPEQRQQLVERMKSRRDLMERHHRERRQLDGATR